MAKRRGNFKWTGGRIGAEEKIDILKRIRAGESYLDLAADYGCVEARIRNIVKTYDYILDD